jgi:hypothetical protein
MKYPYTKSWVGDTLVFDFDEKYDALPDFLICDLNESLLKKIEKAKKTGETFETNGNSTNIIYSKDIVKLENLYNTEDTREIETDEFEKIIYEYIEEVNKKNKKEPK